MAVVGALRRWEQDGVVHMLADGAPAWLLVWHEQQRQPRYFVLNVAVAISCTLSNRCLGWTARLIWIVMAGSSRFRKVVEAIPSFIELLCCSQRLLNAGEARTASIAG